MLLTPADNNKVDNEVSPWWRCDEEACYDEGVGHHPTETREQQEHEHHTHTRTHTLRGGGEYDIERGGVGEARGNQGKWGKEGRSGGAAIAIWVRACG